MTIVAGQDSAGVRRTLDVGGRSYAFYSIPAAEAAGLGEFSKLPAALKVVLENLLRFEDGGFSVSLDDIRAFGDWAAKGGRTEREINYRPARVLMQDFTGVPAVVDLAAMRDGILGLGGDAQKINPLNPVDLVIDHSGHDRRVRQRPRVPGQRGAGIRAQHGALPVPEMGPDGLQQLPRGAARHRHLPSGEPRIPGAGRLDRHDQTGRRSPIPTRWWDRFAHDHGQRRGRAWAGASGGIEAEAAMLGQPVSMLIPEVVGFKLTGRPARGTTATDLVLKVVQMLRKHGVVGKFVEFYGEGLDHLPLADRATIGNMAPEYGATCGFFPSTRKRCATCASRGATRRGSPWWKPMPRRTASGAMTATSRFTPRP
jgi:aconitate hydratase